MKALTKLFNKVFKSKKQVELTEDEFDAWIVSIRQKPQLVGKPITVYVRNSKPNNSGLEAAGNLVLA
jgi:hypothetical protein